MFDASQRISSEGEERKNSLLHVLQSTHVGSTRFESEHQLSHVLLGHSVVGHRKEVDDDQAKLVLVRAGHLVPISKDIEDRSLGLLERNQRKKSGEARSRKKNGGTDLLGDRLLGLEERVETSRLDGLEKSGSDVHVGIQGVFTSGEFRKEVDGGFEVGGVGGEVAVRSKEGAKVSSILSSRLLSSSIELTSARRR